MSTTTAATPAAQCLDGIRVSFSGYLDTDNKHRSDNSNSRGGGGGGGAEDDDTNNHQQQRPMRPDLVHLNGLARSHGARVDGAVGLGTDLVVTWRGLTRKRLEADRHGIAVGSPEWFLVTLPALDTSHMRPLLSSVPPPPLLSGYVFCDTRLLPEESSTLAAIIAGSGGLLAHALTPRCDALLVSADYARLIAELSKRLEKRAHMRAVAAAGQRENDTNSKGKRKKSINRHQSHINSSRSSIRASAAGSERQQERGKAAAQRGRANGENDDDDDRLDAEVGRVLSQKVIFALISDIPILSYDKFLSMACLTASAAAAAASFVSGREDFDTIVESSCVGASVALLERIARVSGRSSSGGGSGDVDDQLQHGTDVGENEEDEDEHNGAEDSNNNSNGDASFHSSSSTSTRFASVASSDLDPALHCWYNEAREAAADATANNNSNMDTLTSQNADEFYSSLPALADARGDGIVPHQHEQQQQQQQRSDRDVVQRYYSARAVESDCDGGSTTSTTTAVAAPTMMTKAAVPPSLQPPPRPMGASRFVVSVTNGGQSDASSSGQQQQQHDDGVDSGVSSSLLPPPPPQPQPAWEIPFYSHHPPWVSVCLVGCTGKETRDAARMALICRFLLMPVPTADTDVVVLGRQAVEKKSVRSRRDAVANNIDDDGNEEGDSNGGGNDRHGGRRTSPPPTLRAAARAANQRRVQGQVERQALKRRQYEQRQQQGGSSTRGTVITFHEVSRELATGLREWYSIPIHRLAPLSWLRACYRLVQVRAKADETRAKGKKKKKRAIEQQQQQHEHGGGGGDGQDRDEDETLPGRVTFGFGESFNDAQTQLGPDGLRRAVPTQPTQDGDNNTSGRLAEVLGFEPLAVANDAGPSLFDYEMWRQRRLVGSNGNEEEEGDGEETGVGFHPWPPLPVWAIPNPQSPAFRVVAARATAASPFAHTSTTTAATATDAARERDTAAAATVATTAPPPPLPLASSSSSSLSASSPAVAVHSSSSALNVNRPVAAAATTSAHGRSISSPAPPTGHHHHHQQSVLAAATSVQSEADATHAQDLARAAQLHAEFVGLITPTITMTATTEGSAAVAASSSPRASLAAVVACLVDGDFARPYVGALRALVKLGGGNHLKLSEEEWTAALRRPRLPLLPPLSTAAATASAVAPPGPLLTRKNEQLVECVRRSLIFGKSKRALFGAVLVHCPPHTRIAAPPLQLPPAAAAASMSSATAARVQVVSHPNQGNEEQQQQLAGAVPSFPFSFFSPSPLVTASSPPSLSFDNGGGGGGSAEPSYLTMDDSSLLDGGAVVAADGSARDALVAPSTTATASIAVPCVNAGDAAALQKVQRFAADAVRTGAVALTLVPHGHERQHAAGGGVGYLSNNNSSSINVPAKSALRYLPRVTSDYLLCCLAVGCPLAPTAFFVFHTPLPAAEAALARRLTMQTAGGRTTAAARGTTAAASPVLPPRLSPWLRDRRFEKREFAGVAVTFLWIIPKDEAGTWGCGGGVAVPSDRVSAVLRVLSNTLCRAVACLGGSVANAGSYNPNAVTHVVTVNVAAIMATTLGDCFLDASSPWSGALPSTAAVPSEINVNADTTNTVWPLDDARAVIAHLNSNSNRRVNNHTTGSSSPASLTSTAWLADCLPSGTFIDEYGKPEYAQPLAEIESLVAAASVHSNNKEPQAGLGTPRRGRGQRSDGRDNDSSNSAHGAFTPHSTPPPVAGRNIKNGVSPRSLVGPSPPSIIPNATATMRSVNANSNSQQQQPQHPGQMRSDDGNGSGGSVGGTLVSVAGAFNFRTPGSTPLPTRLYGLLSTPNPFVSDLSTTTAEAVESPVPSQQQQYVNNSSNSRSSVSSALRRPRTIREGSQRTNAPLLSRAPPPPQRQGRLGSPAARAAGPPTLRGGRSSSSDGDGCRPLFGSHNNTGNNVIATTANSPRGSSAPAHCVDLLMEMHESIADPQLRSERRRQQRSARASRSALRSDDINIDNNHNYQDRGTVDDDEGACRLRSSNSRSNPPQLALSQQQQQRLGGGSGAAPASPVGRRKRNRHSSGSCSSGRSGGGGKHACDEEEDETSYANRIVAPYSQLGDWIPRAGMVPAVPSSSSSPPRRWSHQPDLIGDSEASHVSETVADQTAADPTDDDDTATTDTDDDDDDEDGGVIIRAGGLPPSLSAVGETTETVAALDIRRDGRRRRGANNSSSSSAIDVRDDRTPAAAASSEGDTTNDGDITNDDDDDHDDCVPRFRFGDATAADRSIHGAKQHQQQQQHDAGVDPTAAHPHPHPLRVRSRSSCLLNVYLLGDLPDRHRLLRQYGSAVARGLACTLPPPVWPSHFYPTTTIAAASSGGSPALPAMVTAATVSHDADRKRGRDADGDDANTNDDDDDDDDDDVDVDVDVDVVADRNGSNGPFFFVHSIEGADCLVAHEITPRETVLAAVAAGLWVVKPTFLAAIVDAMQRHRSWGDYIGPESNTSGNNHNSVPVITPDLLAALERHEWRAGPVSSRSRSRSPIPGHQQQRHHQEQHHQLMAEVRQSLTAQCVRRRRARQEAGHRRVLAWPAMEAAAAAAAAAVASRSHDNDAAAAAATTAAAVMASLLYSGCGGVFAGQRFILFFPTPGDNECGADAGGGGKSGSPVTSGGDGSGTSKLGRIGSTVSPVPVGPLAADNNSGNDSNTEGDYHVRGGDDAKEAKELDSTATTTSPTTTTGATPPLATGKVSARATASSADSQQRQRQPSAEDTWDAARVILRSGGGTIASTGTLHTAATVVDVPTGVSNRAPPPPSSPLAVGRPSATVDFDLAIEQITAAIVRALLTPTRVADISRTAAAAAVGVGGGRGCCLLPPLLFPSSHSSSSSRDGPALVVLVENKLLTCVHTCDSGGGGGGVETLGARLHRFLCEGNSSDDDDDDSDNQRNGTAASRARAAAARTMTATTTDTRRVSLFDVTECIRLASGHAQAAYQRRLASFAAEHPAVAAAVEAVTNATTSMGISTAATVSPWSRSGVASDGWRSVGSGGGGDTGGRGVMSAPLQTRRLDLQVQLPRTAASRSPTPPPPPQTGSTTATTTSTSTWAVGIFNRVCAELLPPPPASSSSSAAKVFFSPQRVVFQNMSCVPLEIAGIVRVAEDRTKMIGTIRL